MIRTALVALTILSTVPAPASARLVNQFLRGEARVCQYDDPKGAYSNRAEKSLTVEIGDACPADPVAPAIPGMAVLSGARIDGGQRICTYSYVGRRYERVIAVEQGCTYTPN